MIRILAFFAITSFCGAAQYYVRTDGSNTNAGTANTSGGAWLTIQKAATTMVAGDTVTVQAGTYTENVTTGANGTAMARIAFNTSGTVNHHGRWTISHAYQTVSGFVVRYPMGVSSLHGYFQFTDNGDNCIVENNTLGPGVAIVLTDCFFNDNTPSADTITSATGGFISAGFIAGGAVWAMNTNSGSNITNATPNRGSSWTIDTVTDNTITLASGQNVLDEDGKPCFLHGIRNCFTFGTLAQNNIIRNNAVSNVAARWAIMQGTGNTLEGNQFANTDGFDGILYGGTNTVIRRNLMIGGNTYRYHNPSPDSLGVLSPGSPTNILMEENMFLNSISAAGFDHGNPSPGPITWRRNVFANVAFGYLLRSRLTTFEHNTFYYVGNPESSLAQASDHPIVYENWDLAGNPTTTVIKGNAFVGNGKQNAGNPLAKGWYRNDEGVDLGLTANYNFATGVAPGFAARTGFSEANGVNGGDPRFVNASDPLGPDGLVFTSDDGLRLATGSPLIGTGEAGADIGAYDYTPAGGTLNAANLNLGTLILERNP